MSTDGHAAGVPELEDNNGSLQFACVTYEENMGFVYIRGDDVHPRQRPVLHEDDQVQLAVLESAPLHEPAFRKHLRIPSAELGGCYGGLAQIGTKIR